MKIAVISDIHGNHVALESVLAEAVRCGVERLFVLGDLVGYYYHPDSVMELLDSWPKEMIQGNHEGMLSAAARDADMGEVIRTTNGSGVSCALKKLRPESIDALSCLPARRTVLADGLRFELCHGAPWDRDFYIYPDAERETLEKCAVRDASFVLIGHTHYPFCRTIDGTTLANAGSVGQARDKGGFASWAIVDTRNRALVFKHSAYDTSGIIEEVKKTDPHLPYLFEVLQRQ